MTTRLTTLALVTLALLGTACDPEATTSSVEEQTFRGDTISPPTTTTTGTFTLKGGHDNPEEWGHAFEECSRETQVAFYRRGDKAAADLIMEAFATDENNIELAIERCEDQHMSWNGDFSLQYVHVEHGRVAGVVDEGGSWGWESQARVIAEIAFGCV